MIPDLLVILVSGSHPSKKRIDAKIDAIIGHICLKIDAIIVSKKRKVDAIMKN